MKALNFVAAAMMLASTALAQPPDKRNEVFVSVGDATMIFVVGNADLSQALDFGHPEGGAMTVVAGYQRRFGNWASAGISAGWAKASTSTGFFIFRGPDVTRDLQTVMLDGRAHWLRKPAWDLYSGVAIGAAMVMDHYEATSVDLARTASDPFFAYQATLLGVRAGGGLGAFLELGAGYHSLFKAGLSGRW